MAQTKPKQNKNLQEKKRPERRCVGCGGTFPKKELIRVVRIPEPKEGEPVPERRVFLDVSGLQKRKKNGGGRNKRRSRANGGKIRIVRSVQCDCYGYYPFIGRTLKK